MKRSRRIVTRREVLGAVSLFGIGGCLDQVTGDPTPTPASDQPPSDDGVRGPTSETLDIPDESPLTADIEITPIAEQLEIPWDMAVTPNGDMFISERTGRIVRINADEVETVARPGDVIDAGAVEPGTDEQPWWVEGGEGGTLGISIHPEFPDAPYLYVYYTASEILGRRNRVVRYDVKADSPAETGEVVVDDIPADDIHNGGRLVFGPDDMLWICTGDAGTPELAQDQSSLAGKILRVTPEGDPAPDNPEIGADSDSRIFTYGHRNPQGISWLPSGIPICSEHGPTGRDEINVLRAGRNYGWPNVRDESEYRDTDYQRPVVNTGPNQTWAPSGCVLYTADAIPQWKNRLLVGGLISQALFFVTIAHTDQPIDYQDGARYDADWLDPEFTAVVHQGFDDEVGRIRHITQANDGSVYVITSNRDGRATDGFPTDHDDMLYRLADP